MLTDKEKTGILTKLGYLKLKDMGCLEISTEVNIHTWLLPTSAIRQNTRHHFIDVLGIELEYLPPSKQKINENGYKVKTQRILRGIEIKVSKSDFKNGFIQLGCHYNYLLTPKGLINPLKTPKEIGLIEGDVTLEKLSTIKKTQTHWLGLLKLIRKPTRKEVPERIIDLCESQISRTLTNQTTRWILEGLYKQENT